MTFLVDIILQVVISIVIPLYIIKYVYAKTGKIRKIIILPFFLLDWLIRAYTAVLFYGTMSNFFEWICDTCVFVLPIVAICLVNRIFSNGRTAQDSKETAADMSNKIVPQKVKEPISYPSEIITITAVPQLSRKLDGKLVHVVGSFTVDENGYRINIRHTQDPLVISSSIPKGVHVKLPNPFDINTWLEVIPAPTSDAASWKRELDNNHRLFGSDKNDPVPSVYGIIRYINNMHYQIVGAFNSLEKNNPQNEIFLATLAKSNKYLLPIEDEHSVRERITRQFDPASPQYGLTPMLPICLRTVQDVKKFVDLIRDSDGCAYCCQRYPSSIQCVNIPTLGVLHVYEYSLASLAGENKFSIFVCPYGTLSPDPNSKIYAPHGYNLSYEDVSTLEDLVKTSTPLVQEELIDHYNARKQGQEFLLYLPIDDGYTMVACDLNQILSEGIVQCCNDDAELKRIPADIAAKRIQTKLIYKIYEKFVSSIRWTLARSERECIERSNDPTFKEMWSEAYINYKIEKASEKNLNKLIKEGAFELPEEVPIVIESENESILDQPEEKLFCRKCGTQLPLDSHFCFKCGTKVEDEGI